MSRQLRQSDISPNGKISSHAGKGPKSVARPAAKKNVRGRLRLTNRAQEASLMDDSDEQNDSDTLKEDGTTTDDADEEDAIAPSGKSHRRGHQTGLSVSMSNTAIGSGRKRTWSNRIQEDDDMKRPEKLSRPDSDTSQEDGEFSDSDDDYAGVDLISDAEDAEDGDDEILEADEEQLIIDSEEDSDDDEEETPRPGTSSSEVSWTGFADENVVEDNSHFEGALERISTNMEVASAKSARRVRFVDEIAGLNSSSAESDEEDNFFPDLLLDRDTLDERFRAILDKEGHSDSEESYWDLGFEDDTAIDGQAAEEDDEGASSGYETDEGETTDEDILPPTSIRSASTLSTSANAKSPARTPVKPIRRGLHTPGSSANRQGPSLASWTVDPDKPYVTVDKTGSTMIFYPATRTPSRPNTANASMVSSANASPTRSYATLATYESEHDRSDVPDIVLQSPVNPMMSGFTRRSSNGARSYGNTAESEAFFPWRSIDDPSNDNDDDDDEEYDDEGEDDYDIDAFFDFGSDEEDGDEQAGGVEVEQGRIAPMIATSFRRNQDRVQGGGRAASAFKPEGVVKRGRLSSASQPISPMRKQKARSGLNALPVTRRTGLLNN